MIQDVGGAVRALIAFATGIPPQNVRPADQIVPSGGQSKEICTVRILSTEMLADLAEHIETVGTFPSDTSTEYADTLQRAVVSVNFYRSPDVDGAGIQKYNTRAFDRAACLSQQLWLSANIDKATALKLAFVKASPARNLAGVIDKTFESRGQVDLTFDFVHRMSAPIQTVIEADVTLDVQSPEGDITTRTFEVTT